MKTIINLPKYADKLPINKKKLFYRLYSVQDDFGLLKLPEEMKPWVKKKFGSIKAVEKQKIIRIDNNITCETALFNELRANVPINMKSDSEVKKIIKDQEGGFFCNLDSQTANDVFGRIIGDKSKTASNIAKYDALHGIVVFDKHNPLGFKEKDVSDYFKTANKWIKEANAMDKKRVYPYVLWNCLWRAGSSIVHGHMQIILGKERHYGEIERLKRFSEGYKIAFKSNYFEDLYSVHEAVGLGFKKNENKIFMNLTPRKEKEVMIIGSDLESVSSAVYKVLKAYLKLGVQSFNVGIYLSPLDNSWDFPLVVRIVDRGNLNVKTGDFGGVEVFAGTSVIASDPYKVFEKVKKSF